MNIATAKVHVKDTIEAYLAVDEQGIPLLEPARQRPLFLVGAPGIGKTAIMSQIASELGIGLVSYSMTHHTRQSALGLPFITQQTYGDFSYEASEYTMSEIVASVYDYMRNTGVEQGILFLDEINCVSETLYPSMLQFLQFKTFGRHKVPDGWIVVTAGNPPEYNRSVHEFDIVTLDRLKKIEVQPDFEAWKTYALSKGTHPAVLTFLETKKNRFYSVEKTLDGSSFVTARGWDDLSDIIGVFEKLGKAVDYDLIVQYVQNDTIAREFASYYDLFSKYRDDYKIEAILAGQIDAEVEQRAKDASFDERLSLVGLLLDALDGDIRAIMEETDVTISLRDELRKLKSLSFDDVDGFLRCLEELVEEKKTALDYQVARGSLSREKRAKSEKEIAKLREYFTEAKGSGATSVQTAFSAAEALYVGEVGALQERHDVIEQRLSHAFAFADRVFGDGQEMLILTTELTSRTECARYIAQYGSNSYFEHNQNMILSERQEALRKRIEELVL